MTACVCSSSYSLLITVQGKKGRKRGRKKSDLERDLQEAEAGPDATELALLQSQMLEVMRGRGEGGELREEGGRKEGGGSFEGKEGGRGGGWGKAG